MQVSAARPDFWHGILKAIQEEDCVVLKKLSTLPLLAFIVLIEPLRA